MRTFLGVDAGNSKTHALLVNERGRVLGFGQSGGGNHQSDGLENALQAIRSASLAAIGTDRSVAHPGIKQATVDHGFFCLAGADFPEDYASLHTAIQNLGLAHAIIIKNDTMAALRAGLSQPWGVVVICGAGFNAAGRAPDGCEIVLPGQGYTSGDWGGGGDLSEEMIRLVMRAWDGRSQSTRLTPLILQALQVPDEAALLDKLYHDEIDHDRQLELVPLLFEAAEQGDEPARQLIIRLGVEVGITARTLIRRLGLEKTDVEVVLGGSVFKGKGTLLVETISKEVHTLAPQARVVKPRFEPVVGAAMLGLEALGRTIDKEIIANLENTLPARLINSPETIQNK